jgi:hypothetical protein
MDSFRPYNTEFPHWQVTFCPFADLHAPTQWNPDAGYSGVGFQLATLPTPEDGDQTLVGSCGKIYMRTAGKQMPNGLEM